MPADAELSSLLSRRQRINDELEEGKEVKKQYKFVNVYTEFHELSRREIKQYEQTFNRWAFLLFLHFFFSSLAGVVCDWKLSMKAGDIAATRLALRGFSLEMEFKGVKKDKMELKGLKD